MKHLLSTRTGIKAILLSLLFVLLIQEDAAARKIYINKGSDNGVYINGNNFSYAPGDTFVLRASQNPFSYFSLENINGNSGAWVVVINEGGQTQVSAMAANHCTYLKFTGTGSGDQYGFYMSSPNQSHLAPAVEIHGRSKYVEVDHVDINYHGYGFWIKEEATCDVSLQYPNWVLDNIYVHDNRMSNLTQEGIYAGSTAPNGERPIYCNGITPLPIRLGNIRIYNNIINRTGRGGIQLSSADAGTNEIYGNTVSNCGSEYVANQGNGIVLGSYTSAYVHHNTVDYTFSSGIFSLGAGMVRIENNTVDHSGQLDGRNAISSASIMIDTRPTTPLKLTTFQVKNNSLGANSDVNVRVYNTYETYTTNNVICSNNSLGGSPATVYVTGSTIWTSCATSNNIAPVVQAGPDQTITLPTNSVSFAGSATDADGSISTYKWTQISGASGTSFSATYAAHTMVYGLTQGSYTFRLTVTDNGGAITTDDIVVNVTGTDGSTGAGTQKIEAENYSSMNGIQKENCSDVGGGQNVAWQDNNDWMDYSVTVNSAGTYTVNFRVATMFNGPQFQLRNASGSVLATVNVPNTGWFQTWQNVSAQVNLPAGQQTLRIVTTNAAGGWNINWWEISGASTGSNQSPTANAGSAQTISLPTSSATLNGNGTDPDGTISAYQWSTVSGPSTVSFSNASGASTTVSALVQGSYTFRLKVTDNAGATATSDVAVTVNAGQSFASPSNKRIEAEQFSNMSGIQTENTSDAGGGMNVAWQDDNDWMDYSVNVEASSTYTVNFRVASMFSGAQFQLRRPDGTVLATVTVPNTGGFQTWETVSAQITLPAGQQTFRIYTSRANGGWNINWWELASNGTSSSPEAFAPSSQKIEAEQYSSMNGIQVENTTDAGGGQNVAWQDDNDWMDYSVNISSSGLYTINFRVATMFNGPQFQLRNADGSVLATVSVPNTGWFQTWQTVSMQVTLPAGQQTLRIVTTNAAGGWNINWWEIVSASATTKAIDNAEVMPDPVTASSMEIFPNPVSDRFALKVNNEETGTMKVAVYDMSGALRKTFSIPKATKGVLQTYLSIGSLAKGEYILQAVIGEWKQSRKIIKL